MHEVADLLRYKDVSEGMRLRDNDRTDEPGDRPVFDLARIEGARDRRAGDSDQVGHRRAAAERAAKRRRRKAAEQATAARDRGPADVRVQRSEAQAGAQLALD